MGTLYDDLVREAGEGGALDGDYSQVGHTHPLTDIGPAAAETVAPGDSNGGVAWSAKPGTGAECVYSAGG